jgi:hypothetical protein
MQDGLLRSALSRSSWLAAWLAPSAKLAQHPLPASPYFLFEQRKSLLCRSFFSLIEYKETLGRITTFV